MHLEYFAFYKEKICSCDSFAMDGRVLAENNEEQSVSRNNDNIRGRSFRRIGRPCYNGSPVGNATNDPNQNQGNRYRGGRHRRSGRGRFNAYRRNVIENDPIPPDLENGLPNGVVSSGPILNPCETGSVRAVPFGNLLKDLTLRGL